MFLIANVRPCDIDISNLNLKRSVTRKNEEASFSQRQKTKHREEKEKEEGNDRRRPL